MFKNYSYYSLLTAVPVAVLILLSFTSGQGGNFSGSPGDGGTTCTACHTPGANHSGTVALTGVPSQVVANQVYNFNLAITGSTVSKFGFNITAEDSNNNKIGTWTAGTGSRNRNGGAGDGLTHTSAGTSQNSWNIMWTAPANATNDVTFYYATIQANNAAGNNGDFMVSGSSDVTASVNDENLQVFTMYPTVVSSTINLELLNDTNATFRLYNTSGQIVYNQLVESNVTVDLSSLSSGIYIAQVNTDSGKSTQRLIKK